MHEISAVASLLGIALNCVVTWDYWGLLGVTSNQSRLLLEQKLQSQASKEIASNYLTLRKVIKYLQTCTELPNITLETTKEYNIDYRELREIAR